VSLNMCLGKPFINLKLFVLSAIGLVALLTSCYVLDPQEPIPSYIKLEAPRFTTESNTQGSASENISDYWIFVDDELIGVFEYPIEFPVLKSGNVNLEVFAGIKNNGISAERISYPFYQRYKNDSSAFLSPGETTQLEPKFTYETQTEFAWLEDFENLNVSIDDDFSSTTTFEVYKGDNVFEGNSSGLVKLDFTKNRAFFSLNEPVDLPKFGTDIYLELDFLTDLEFFVGLRAFYSDGSQRDIDLVGINPNTEWQKIYIDLAEFVSTEVNAQKFSIYFFAQYSGAEQDPESNLYLDNIKLVHF